MTTLLHLDSSASHSGEPVTRELTALFARAWRSRRGSAGYRYRDLAAGPAPPVDAAYCRLGRRLERQGVAALDKVAALAESPAGERQWALTLPLIMEVRAAGVVLAGAPVYNLSVPASLKAWTGRITFPGAFTDPDTGDSVLSHTRVVVGAARGGAYGPGAPGEGQGFQVPCLRAYFRRQGVAESGIHVVSSDLTLAGSAPGMARLRPQAERSPAEARARATELAAALGQGSRRAPGRVCVARTSWRTGNAHRPKTAGGAPVPARPA